MGLLASVPSWIGSCFVSSAASCCTGMICNCCCGSFSCSKSVSTRIFYLLLFITMTILSWILRNWAQDILNFIPMLKDQCPYDLCYGALSVARLMFSYSVFHFLLGLLMIGVKSGDDFRVGFQDGFWPIKILFLMGVTVASFFIPNEFFVYYDWVAFSGAIIFITIQLILLLEFAHSWSENWTVRLQSSEEGSNGWLYALLFATFTMYAIAFTMIVLIYVYFTGGSGSDCKLNIFFVTFTMIVCLLFSLAAVNPKVQEKNPKASLLPASVVTLFSVYLVWSAVMSEPPSENGCNGWTGNVASNISILLGGAMTLVAVSYSTIRASLSSSELMGGRTDPLLIEKSEPIRKKDEEEGKGKKEEEDDVDDDEKEKPVYNYFYFHMIFLLGAMYMSELLTNWSVLSKDNNKIAVDTGYVAVWLKIVSGWLAMLLYVWSLVAPIIFPDRDFS
eukprot:TRINITY_DN6843_c0_g1_i1.p1 TRINITY_DN6843_c0_g1~~TRINITY_DN6843_c0_g1_i1.p1  ORF type:complete len:447 (-),score=108.50 TRINITY_DN6843_c0_g1_i1:66-1406(-)